MIHSQFANPSARIGEIHQSAEVVLRREDGPGRDVTFRQSGRVYHAVLNRRGTLHALYTDLAMVLWDDRDHDSADPTYYEEILPIPDGWDSV